MKRTSLLLMAVMPMFCLMANAQSDHAKQRDFSLALTLGYNSFASVEALPMYQPSYETKALSVNWTEKQMMIGAEAGVFVADFWKISLSGGFNFSNNPGQVAIAGTVDDSFKGSEEDLMVEIPTYKTVPGTRKMTYNIVLGGDRYFKVPHIENLMWFVGLRSGFAYATDELSRKEYMAMGKSLAETWNIMAGAAFGAEYHFRRGFYVGAHVLPASWTYSISSYKPQEGLSALSADTFNWSVFASPTLKVGFVFGK